MTVRIASSTATALLCMNWPTSCSRKFASNSPISNKIPRALFKIFQCVLVCCAQRTTNFHIHRICMHSIWMVCFFVSFSLKFQQFWTNFHGISFTGFFELCKWYRKLLLNTNKQTNKMMIIIINTNLATNLAMGSECASSNNFFDEKFGRRNKMKFYSLCIVPNVLFILYRMRVTKISSIRIKRTNPFVLWWLFLLSDRTDGK